MVEPTEEQYLIIQALDTLELLGTHFFDEETGDWYIQTPSPNLPYAIILPDGSNYVPKLETTIMNQANEIQHQHYRKFTEIFEQGKQRYIEFVGHSKGYVPGVKGKDYLSDEEREEAKQLLRKLFEKNSIETTIYNRAEEPTE